eukprot:47477-Hanusia_phi.AAC.1
MSANRPLTAQLTITTHTLYAFTIHMAMQDMKQDTSYVSQPFPEQAFIKSYLPTVMPFPLQK